MKLMISINVHSYVNTYPQAVIPSLGQDERIEFPSVAPCHVMPFEEDGTILLNIMESRGSEIDQTTEPPVLPVSGEPGVNTTL